MRTLWCRAGLVLLVSFGLSNRVQAGESWTNASAQERGRQALTGTSFVAPEWGLDAYPTALSRAGQKAPAPEADPQGYQDAFNDRYGLHRAPYANDGLPMGLRRATAPDGRVGLNLDCMTCHGGSIGGRTYVGLGNTQIDIEALLTDLTVADDRPAPKFVLFRLNTTRGNNNAGQLAVFLLSLRNARDLSKRSFPLITGTQLPELDTPAWWLLKKKQTKYYDGRTPAQAVRSNMQ
ncbi:MAG TPA: hypothetical protein VFT74_22055, partial [Isosphaeraceae bacterium]|nr:hypothetical protein [Isosphaeraceae bacterium]